MPSLHKNELVQLAEEKAADAVLLLQHGRNSNAYYLAGYAIEIGLKAKIAGDFQADTLPDKSFVNKVYVHSLIELLRLAGLEAELDRRRRVDPAFSKAWSVVASWSESRYAIVDAAAATAMVDAVRDGDAGILPWLKTFW